MKKVMRLVNVQIWAMLGSMFAIGEAKKKKPKALYTGLVIFVVAMSSISFFYSYMLGSGLKMFGSIDILPSMIMAVTSIMVLFTTIFKVKGTIFGFKDYDMVMSLPVSNGGIVASRLILLYGINLMFVFMIMLPMMAAYGILARPGVMFYVYGLPAVFFVPLVPIILASFLGTLVTYASAKFRHSNILYIIFTFLALLALILLPMTFGESEEELVNVTRVITNQVNATYPLASLYSKAVTGVDGMAFLAFLFISFSFFLLYSFLVGRVFKRINSLIMTGKYRADYKMGELKVTAPLAALYRKEIKRYFSSPLYVMNTGFGMVMLVLGSIALLFVDLESLLGTAGTSIPIKDMIPVYVSFCIITTSTTMASISLEGKSLWILKSLPVSAKTIFLSKVLVNLTIASPVIPACVLVSIAAGLGFLQGISLLLSSFACAAFTALFGLLMNLWYPNFEWTSETVVIKQSAASSISIFSGMGIVGVQFVLIMLMKDLVYGNLIFLGIMAFIDFLLYRGLRTYGIRRFHAL